MMNKQELIEKAVIDFNGEMPETASALLTTGTSWKHSKNVAGKVLPAIKIDGYHGYEWHEKGDSYPLISDESWVVLCTREEFNAAADRLRGKPDWSMLPAEAEWLAQDRCGTWKPMQGRKPTIEKGSYWITDHHLQPQVCGTVIGDWRNTLEKQPEQKVEPAPAKPWFEAGELPKAGTKCLCYFDDGRECWHECVVIGSIDDEIKNGYLAVSLIGKHERKLAWVSDFKPIKTDKEKAIDAAVRVCTGVNIATTTDGLTMKTLNKLYDAGLLRLPDQK